MPGSWSTGALWRDVIALLGDRFRTVTTSLLGYGDTEERRTPDDVSIDREIDVIEAVIQRTNSAVHLVGHSGVAGGGPPSGHPGAIYPSARC